MRKIVIPVAVLVILAGGYTALWYKKSADFKQGLEQSIANMNARYQDPEHNDIPFIHYDAVQVSGFPFALTFTFEKPVVNYSGALAEALKKTLNAPTSPTPTLDWKGEYASMGTVSVSSNLLMDKFTFISEGETRNTTVINNTSRHVVAITTDTPSICHIAIAHEGIVPVFTDVPAFLSAMRHMDCSYQGVHVKEATNNVPLGSVDALLFDINSAPAQDGNQSLTLKLQEKNAQNSAAYDAILNDYLVILYTQVPTLKQQSNFSFHMAEYGQRNLTLDAHYEGPVDIKNFTQATKLQADINNYDETNALFSGKGQLHLHVADRNIDFSLHSKGSTTDRYDAFMGAQIGDMLKDIAHKNAATNPPPTAGKPDPAALLQDDAFIKAVVPSIHKLGDTNVDIDVKVSLPDDIKQQSVTIDAFDLSATPYGISLKGNAHRGVLLPIGDITFTCKSCDALVKDLGHYIAGIEQATAKYKPAGTPIVASDRLIDSTNQFLHSIAEKSDAPDVVIHLVMKDTGEMTISDKQPNQVMMLFSTLVGPALQSATAAPTAAPTAPAATAPTPAPVHAAPVTPKK